MTNRKAWIAGAASREEVFPFPQSEQASFVPIKMAQLWRLASRGAVAACLAFLAESRGVDTPIVRKHPAPQPGTPRILPGSIQEFVAPEQERSDLARVNKNGPTLGSWALGSSLLLCIPGEPILRSAQGGLDTSKTARPQRAACGVGIGSLAIVGRRNSEDLSALSAPAFGTRGHFFRVITNLLLTQTKQMFQTIGI